MLLRRLLLSVVTAALIGGPALAQSGDSMTASAAAAYVRQTGNELVGIVNGALPDQQKGQQLAHIINQRVDVNGIARFCLGAFWRQASPAQQKEYLNLFHRVLTLSIDSKMGDYHGVSFTITRTVPAEGGQMVSTIIKRPSQPPANVEWVVQDVDGAPKIVDVIAEGTSLKVTQRSDYSSFILHNNQSIQALLDAMKRQVSNS
jgi:phospholipid transport system substrate-binding protein